MVYSTAVLIHCRLCQLHFISTAVFLPTLVFIHCTFCLLQFLSTVVFCTAVCIHCSLYPLQFISIAVLSIAVFFALQFLFIGVYIHCSFIYCCFIHCIQTVIPIAFVFAVIPVITHKYVYLYCLLVENERELRLHFSVPESKLSSDCYLSDNRFSAIKSCIWRTQRQTVSDCQRVTGHRKSIHGKAEASRSGWHLVAFGALNFVN